MSTTSFGIRKRWVIFFCGAAVISVVSVALHHWNSRWRGAEGAAHAVKQHEGPDAAGSELTADGRPADGHGPITNSVGMKLVLIPPGTFQMGSALADKWRFDNEPTPHNVTFAAGFYMQTTPVSQAQWFAVMGTKPSGFSGENLPVERVTWYDANEFCKRLSAKEGKKYHLPTETEWEYACRAGTTTEYYTGDSEQSLAVAGWYDANSGHSTHAVGTKAANKFGLYDMHGNVSQWCRDRYNSGEAEMMDHTGPCVLRGGSWVSPARGCRAAYRATRVAALNRANYTGFRVCLDVATPDANADVAATEPVPELLTPKEAAAYFLIAAARGDAEAARRSSIGAEPVVQALSDLRNLQVAGRRFDGAIAKKFGDGGDRPGEDFARLPDLANGLAGLALRSGTKG